MNLSVETRHQANSLRESLRRAKRVFASQARAVRRKIYRIEDGQILEVLLQSFGPMSASWLLVHSSLSACGHINGGVSEVIKSLQDWVGPAGLAMPTHTYCYPGSRFAEPVFDKRSTKSLVGTITEHFRCLPGVVRSCHPSHSLALRGFEAEHLGSGHEKCQTPCGHGTPYEKLITGRCAVLLFGATMNSYTLFHTTANAASVPFLYHEGSYRLRYRDERGSIQTLTSRRHNALVPRRFAQMDCWLEERGMLQRAKLGRGELLYVPCAHAVHEAVLNELYRDPMFLVREDFRSQVAQRHRL